MHLQSSHIDEKMTMFLLIIDVGIRLILSGFWNSIFLFQLILWPKCTAFGLNIYIQNKGSF